MAGLCTNVTGGRICAKRTDRPSAQSRGTCIRTRTTCTRKCALASCVLMDNYKWFTRSCAYEMSIIRARIGIKLNQGGKRVSYPLLSVDRPRYTYAMVSA